ncbi:MAG: cupin domain-containing protein [Bacteroidetes bacterium]|nr:cupin domain-containing protein [Bacteroidota bacterium]
MITSGFVIVDPKSRIRVTILETEAETGGRGWLLEHHFPPRAQANIPKHLHLTWTETFEIISGNAFYVVGEERKSAMSGDVIVMPPGVPHLHPWNAGETELVYRQRDDFGGVSPTAVQDVMGVFATRAGLSRDGLTDKRGRPKHPLQLAVTLKLLVSHGGYDASISIPMQKIIAATLGSFAQLLGYKAVIEKYLVSAEQQ